MAKNCPRRTPTNTDAHSNLLPLATTCCCRKHKKHKFILRFCAYSILMNLIRRLSNAFSKSEMYVAICPTLSRFYLNQRSLQNKRNYYGETKMMVHHKYCKHLKSEPMKPPKIILGINRVLYISCFMKIAVFQNSRVTLQV